VRVRRAAKSDKSMAAWGGQVRVSLGGKIWQVHGKAAGVWGEGGVQQVQVAQLALHCII
jgi:hypothetical protein